MKLLALAILLLIAQPVAAAEYEWQVLSVYDGDTFTVQMPGLPPELEPLRVRVVGVDTPELHGKCPAEKAAATKARAFTEATLKGHIVVLRGISWDKFGGRIDAVVLVDGRDLAQAIIAAGLGRPYGGGARQGWCG